MNLIEFAKKMEKRFFVCECCKELIDLEIDNKHTDFGLDLCDGCNDHTRSGSDPFEEKWRWIYWDGEDPYGL